MQAIFPPRLVFLVLLQTQKFGQKDIIQWVYIAPGASAAMPNWTADLIQPMDAAYLHFPERMYKQAFDPDNPSYPDWPGLKVEVKMSPSGPYQEIPAYAVTSQNTIDYSTISNTVNGFVSNTVTSPPHWGEVVHRDWYIGL